MNDFMEIWREAEKTMESLPFEGFLWTTAALFLIITARYLLFAGGAYALLYRWRRERWKTRKIDPKAPSQRTVKREFLFSLLTSAIFAVTGTGIVYFWTQGYPVFYTRVEDYGWTYFFLTLPILMFLHETYFYWTHRWIHHPKLFRRIHRIHHESVNPTPWAAFSFHPWEALIQAVFLPLVLCLMPVHPFMFLTFLMIMTVLSVVNHCGYEFYFKNWDSHWLGRWIISATHHFIHHRRVTHNFGLYFTCWDRWLGTHDPTTETFHQKRQEPSGGLAPAMEVP